MMSLETIRAMSDEQAEKAAKDNSTPYVPFNGLCLKIEWRCDRPTLRIDDLSLEVTRLVTYKLILDRFHSEGGEVLRIVERSRKHLSLNGETHSYPDSIPLEHTRCGGLGRHYSSPLDSDRTQI